MKMLIPMQVPDIAIPEERREFLRNVCDDYNKMLDIVGVFRIDLSFQITQVSDGSNADGAIDDGVMAFIKVFLETFVKEHKVLRSSDAGNHIPALNIEALKPLAAQNADDAEIFGKFLVDAKSEFPEFIETFDPKERREFENGLAVYLDELNEKRNKLVKQAEAEIISANRKAKEAHQRTDAALGAVATAEGLQSLTSHWLEKAKHHQLSRRNNFVLFSVVLALALTVLLLNQAGVIQSTLSHWCGDTPYCPSSWQNFWKSSAYAANGSWVWALLSLKGFLLPVLGVAWLLRILSRQNASHFALENDARQRRALLVSFVRLQELPETKLTEAERLLILSALFRPADSSSPDDPPPNVTELLTKLKP